MTGKREPEALTPAQETERTSFGIEQFNAGVAAERLRIQSIFGLAEYAGREASAAHLAFNTDLTVEQVQGALAGMPLPPKPEAPTETPKATGETPFERAQAAADPDVDVELGAGGASDEDAEFAALLASNRKIFGTAGTA